MSVLFKFLNIFSHKKLLSISHFSALDVLRATSQFCWEPSTAVTLRSAPSPTTCFTAGSWRTAFRRRTGRRCWRGCRRCASTASAGWSRWVAPGGPVRFPGLTSSLLVWLSWSFRHLSGKCNRDPSLFQTEGDNSFHNVAEAAFTLKLIRAVLASGVPGSAVGVITLYRAQMCKVRVTQSLLAHAESCDFILQGLIFLLWFGLVFEKLWGLWLMY